MKVIFRKWLNRYAGDGVIALFPEVPGDRDGFLCQSYEHIGQHGGANYQIVIRDSNPAKPEEYADLMAELIKRGYDELVVVKHETPHMRAVRKRAAKGTGNP